MLTVASRSGAEVNAEFDPEEAFFLAELAASSQCQPERIAGWNCTRCARVAGFSSVAAEHDLEQELLVFTGWSDAYAAPVVLFRGTLKSSLSNWLADLHSSKTDFDLPWSGAEGSRVHSGFFNAYNTSTLRPFVQRQLKGLLQSSGRRPTVLVAGHSLGGALASLAATEMAAGELLPSLGPLSVRLTTFGSPRVGNRAFADFASKVLETGIRVTHADDIVPSLPLESMGFMHLRTEVWLVDIKLDTEKFFSSPVQVAVTCDDADGEDPLCHNGQCSIGICTSTFNHAHGYFGLNLGSDGIC